MITAKPLSTEEVYNYIIILDSRIITIAEKMLSADPQVRASLNILKIGISEARAIFIDMLESVEK